MMYLLVIIVYYKKVDIYNTWILTPYNIINPMCYNNYKLLIWSIINISMTIVLFIYMIASDPNIAENTYIFVNLCVGCLLGFVNFRAGYALNEYYSDNNNNPKISDKLCFLSSLIYNIMAMVYGFTLMPYENISDSLHILSLLITLFAMFVVCSFIIFVSYKAYKLHNMPDKYIEYGEQKDITNIQITGHPEQDGI